MYVTTLAQKDRQNEGIGGDLFRIESTSLTLRLDLGPNLTLPAYRFQFDL